MALHFIFGSSGSGKSNYIYEHILEQSRQYPRQLFFVVVPEQFTMQTQQELVRRQERHAILNIDVVSFQRLAYRVFDELGLSKLQVLEETGKNLVLRKVAQDKQQELTVLGGNMKKPGYINELKSVISELSQYRIGVRELQALSEDESLPAPFRWRMNDIRIMYQGFADYLEGSYITVEEILTVLAQEAANSVLLKDSVLVLDGFTGFTPIQYALLERLFACARDVYVTVTLDEREDPYRLTGMQELFYMSKKTVQTLSRLASEQHMELAEPVQLKHGAKGRFHQAKPLEWLEQNLFRTNWRGYPASSNPADCIFLRSLTDPRRELLFIAGEIKRLVREEGYRYRDIAIVCGDVNMYGNYLPGIFESYEIPFFLDTKNTISFHPLTEMIKSLLLVVEQDFTCESVMDYLRCGLCSVSREETDLLENYLLANRIRGFSRWKNNWVRRKGVTSARELEAVNGLRERIVAQLGPPWAVLKRKDSTVLEKTVALYHCITAQRVQEQLEERRKILEKEGNLALAKEYAQIYKLVMDLLDKTAQLLAEEKMDIGEYRKVLEAGFSASTVGIIPPGYDQVLVGDIVRTRLSDVRILFLAGVNDGLIPKRDNGGGLISEKEREAFLSRGMELAPGAREKAFMQKFYLYLNMTKPSRKLYLTWHRISGEGKEARKSYLVSVIRNMFPTLVPVKSEGPLGLDAVVTPQSARRLLIDGLHKAREGEMHPLFLALLQWYQSQPDWKEQINKLLEAAFYTYERQYMSREVTRALYGEALEGSVTRLEQFAACAYAHFMAYGIGARERELGEFAPVDMGNMFHNALERYSRKLEAAGFKWSGVPKEKQEAMTREAVLETVEEAGYLLSQDARTAYTVVRMERILKKTIETISGQIAASSFSPEGYEVSFAFADDLESVNFTLSEEEKIHLKGRIDRMDVKQEGNQIYVKVVDYKSGHNEFQLVSLYHGLQLQLVVYLNAAVELMKQKYPDKDVAGAGMFYYHIDDPVIDIQKIKGEPTEEAIRREIFEKLKLSGVGFDDSDDSVENKSKKSEREDLETLSGFANEKIQDMGRQIYRGDIAVSPYRMDKKTGCDYCPYHGICGFDLHIPGHGYRNISKYADKELLLEQMREEAAHGNDIYKGPAESH